MPFQEMKLSHFIVEIQINCINLATNLLYANSLLEKYCMPADIAQDVQDKAIKSKELLEELDEVMDCDIDDAFAVKIEGLAKRHDDILIFIEDFHFYLDQCLMNFCEGPQIKKLELLCFTPLEI